jgi:hypothetical protein
MLDRTCGRAKRTACRIRITLGQAYDRVRIGNARKRRPADSFSERQVQNLSAAWLERIQVRVKWTVEQYVASAHAKASAAAGLHIAA